MSLPTKAELHRQLEAAQTFAQQCGATLRYLADLVMRRDAKAVLVATDLLNGEASTGRIGSITIRDGAMEVLGSHWSSALLARSFYELLTKKDGTQHNYVEALFVGEHGDVIVTVQRIDGETPHGMREKAERERDALRAELEQLRRERA